MTDIGSLALVIFDVVAIAGIVTVISWLGHGDGDSLAVLFSIPVNPPWPHGVQEEELKPWPVERLGQYTDTFEGNRVIERCREAASPSPRPSAAAD
jgi:hypothetical protein